jgi:hypothetical protein
MNCRDNDDAVSCRHCEDTGRVVAVDFDGRQAEPCPACTPDHARARLAHEFGTDAQRAEIGRRSRAVPMRTPR